MVQILTVDQSEGYWVWVTICGVSQAPHGPQMNVRIVSTQ